MAQVESEQWTKPKRMSQLVQHFFHSPLPQQAFFGWKAIELLMQSAKRDHGNRAIELGLPKQKTEHRNCQVNVGYPKNAAGIARSLLGQHLHHLHRLVLISFGVVGTGRDR